jgi:hypothetical protein
MPFLRFSRDERGYENTYVLHTFRREGRTTPRVLYWFRTPPSVSVGRLPLDEDAIRAIEEANPDLDFEWTKMLKVKPAPPPRSRDERGGRGERGRRQSTAGPRGGTERPRRAGRPVPIPEVQGAVAAALPGAVTVEVEAAVMEGPVAATPARERADELAAAEHLDAPVADGDGVESPAAVEGPGRHPVVVLVGDQGLARLRARYAEIQARITEKAVDQAAQDEMRAKAETLNPDTWTTPALAADGLERFEAEAEEIKKVLGPRRRRSRRGGRRHRRGPGIPPTDSS